MKLVRIIAVAATAIAAYSAVPTAYAEAARLTNGHLKNYCDQEKHRRGASRAGITNLVNTFRGNRPDLRCLMVFPTGRQGWLLADARSACLYATGSSNWRRQGNSVFCSGSSAGNRNLVPLGNFVVPRARTCRRVGFRFICR